VAPLFATDRINKTLSLLAIELVGPFARDLVRRDSSDVSLFTRRMQGDNDNDLFNNVDCHMEIGF
jgi:hypothetical protein